MATKNSPYEQFLRELRAARTAKDLSQGEVAKRIKLSRAQYTAIENGRSLVNYAHLHNLSVALGVKFIVGNPKLPSAARYAE